MDSEGGKFVTCSIGEHPQQGVAEREGYACYAKLSIDAAELPIMDERTRVMLHEKRGELDGG